MIGAMRRWFTVGLAALLAGCASGEDPALGPVDIPWTVAPYCPEWFPPDLGLEGVELRDGGDGWRAIEVVGRDLELFGVTSAVEVAGERYGIDEEIPGIGTFRAEWRHIGTSSLVEVRSWIEGDDPGAVAVRYLPVVTATGEGLRGLAEPVALGAGGGGEELPAPLLPLGPTVARAGEQLVGGAEGGLYLGPGGIAAAPLHTAVSLDLAGAVAVQVSQDGHAHRPATAVLIGLGVGPAQVLARATTYMGYRTSAEVCRTPTAGWNSAPAYGWPSNPAVLQDGQGAVQGALGYLGADLGVAAGGWYDTIGDWGPGPAYPAGVGAVASVWADHGGELGLWVAPFWVTDESAFSGEHPDALLRDGDGQLLPCALAASGDTCAVVDATHPDGAAHLAAVGARLAGEHGATALLLDHLADATVDGEHHDVSATGVSNLRAGLAALRSAAPGVRLVAVGVPPWQVAGHVDTIHPGPFSSDPAFLDCLVAEVDAPGPRPPACDALAAALNPLDAAASATWADVRARAALLATTAHWNGHLAALDLGPLVVSGLTLDEARTAATLTAMAGGSYLLGDRLDDLEADARDVVTAPVLQDLRRWRGTVVAADWFARPLALPSCWWLELSGGEAAVAVVNWDEAEAVIQVPLDGRDAIEDLWDPDATWSGTDEGIAVAVPAHGVRLILVR